MKDKASVNHPAPERRRLLSSLSVYQTPMTDPLPADPATDAPATPLTTSLASLDTLYFYTQSGIEPPSLVQVNLLDGTLAFVAEPAQLFPTALSGLLAAVHTDAPWLGDLGLPTDPEAALPEAPAPVAEPPLADPETFTLVVGSDRKNFLIGPAANAALFGLGQDDLILVGEGNALAFGGLGNDNLFGGAGDDSLFGNLGNDLLEGGEGDDTLFGGEGDDILYGGAGHNALIGGAGADVFRLGKPEAAETPLVGEAIAPLETDPEPNGPTIIVDFSLTEGDILDLSLIATQPAFTSSGLLPFSVVQTGAHTHLQVTNTLGQTTTEAILLNVEADTLTPAAFRLTPPDGLPISK